MKKNDIRRWIIGFRRISACLALVTMAMSLSGCADPIYGQPVGVDPGGQPLYRYCNGYGRCILTHDRCMDPGGWGASCPDGRPG